MALTDISVRAAKPRDRLFKLSDGGGLQLWITPDGAKRWRLAYRSNGKQKLLALGVYPAVGLKEARTARDEAKKCPAAGFVGAELSYPHLLFELDRADIADRRMSADGVIEPLDIIEYVRPSLVTRAVDFFPDPLGFQLGEEALHSGVVPDIAGSAHRTNDAIVGHQALELLARLLAGPVGMMQQGVRLAATPDRHYQSIRDEP
jgi:hypothetical protein